MMATSHQSYIPQASGDRLAWILLLTLAVIWGSSFMGVTRALEGFDPLHVAAIRISVAALILTAYAVATGRERPGRGQGPRIWFHIVGFAIFSNVLPFSLLSWGQQYVASGFAGVTMAVVPLLVLPLAHVFVPSERMTRAKLVGFSVGFAGTLILIGPGAFARAGGSLEDIARIACVTASLCYAVGSVTTRTAPPSGMVAYSAAALLVAAVIITPLSIAAHGLPAPQGLAPILAVGYLAVFPTAIATLMMVTIIRRAGSSFLSLVNYQVPLWSVVFGATLLGEELPPSIFLALALILGGLGLSQVKRRRT
jgi:drug/metabolite transporter (DMT)-like permease